MLTRAALREALEHCGIEFGDTVHIQSDLARIGPVEYGLERHQILKFYEDALREVVGPEGTISVFTLFTDYGRKATPFHRGTTPSQAGVLSEHFRKLPGARRSKHPLSSISVIGARASQIADGNHFSAYGYDSAWMRLFKARPKFIALGMGVNEGGSSFFHVIENAYGVPYLYTKVFDTPVYDYDGSEIAGPFTCGLRYLDFGITYNTTPLKAAMVEQGIAQCVKIGSGAMFVCSGQRWFDHGIALLSRDRYAFLRSPPTFRKGEIPFDGPTGPAQRVYDAALTARTCRA